MKKRILGICIALVMMLPCMVALAACGGAKKLATPVLTVDGTTVSWAAVENAENYTVNIDGTDRLVPYGQSLSLGGYPVKDYAVKVRANAANYSKEYKNSDWSETKTVKVTVATITFTTDTPFTKELDYSLALEIEDSQVFVYRFTFTRLSKLTFSSYSGSTFGIYADVGLTDELFKDFAGSKMLTAGTYYLTISNNGDLYTDTVIIVFDTDFG